MQNLDAIWSALDGLALEVATVNKTVATQLIAKNRELMSIYAQLAAEMVELMSAKGAKPPSANGKPKEPAKP